MGWPPALRSGSHGPGSLLLLREHDPTPTSLDSGSTLGTCTGWSDKGFRIRKKNNNSDSRKA